LAMTLTGMKGNKMKLKTTDFSKKQLQEFEHKYELIKQRMSEGRDFNQICDDKDIYFTSDEVEFVYCKFLLKWEM
jgi:hypothetical protein